MLKKSGKASALVRNPGSDSDGGCRAGPGSANWEMSHTPPLERET